jgi:hypothetical protein
MKRVNLKFSVIATAILVMLSCGGGITWTAAANSTFSNTSIMTGTVPAEKDGFANAISLDFNY